MYALLTCFALEFRDKCCPNIILLFYYLSIFLLSLLICFYDSVLATIYDCNGDFGSSLKVGTSYGIFIKGSTILYIIYLGFSKSCLWLFVLSKFLSEAYYLFS